MMVCDQEKAWVLREERVEWTTNTPCPQLLLPEQTSAVLRATRVQHASTMLPQTQPIVCCTAHPRCVVVPAEK